MELAEMLKYQDKVGTIIVDNNFRIEVNILDVKQAYGRLRLLVAPVHGDGNSCWINGDRVTLIDS